MQNKIQVDSSALFQKQKHHQKLEVEKQGCKSRKKNVYDILFLDSSLSQKLCYIIRFRN